MSDRRDSRTRPCHRGINGELSDGAKALFDKFNRLAENDPSRPLDCHYLPYPKDDWDVDQLRAAGLVERYNTNPLYADAPIKMRLTRRGEEIVRARHNVDNPLNQRFFGNEGEA